ncbi:MAG: rod shape-determining protein RodA [Desulfuromonadales bacterium]|nr:rod shape-determining protein RodA [Desulfuromonadales bacterium]
MFDRRLVTHFDWMLLGLIVAVAGLGILNLCSVTADWSAATPVYLKQLTWFALGLGIAFSLCIFDYRHLEYSAFFAYGFTLFLLLAVMLVGRTAMGATRWLSLGPFNLQPSEIAKVVIIIALARYFALHGRLGGLNLKELLIPLCLVLLPVVFILKQPDLGTAMMLLLIGATMILFAGVNLRTFITLTGVAVAAAWTGWSFLHDYQRQRVFTFLNPEADPRGSGYHIIQSKIAIGSGSLTGKGFMEGTQSQLAFLPERHTDFAFSVFAEEWGFIGTAVLITLYLLIIIWGIYIARRASDRFGMYLAVGVTAMLFWHIIINLGMVTGLLPVVGIPLPLFSYGGTSMVTTMIGAGLLLNVSMRRFMF